MKKFIIAERYKLEIHWQKVKYNQKGVASFEGCYLSGPVLSEVEQLSENDFIKLDFVNQYLIFVKYYYIAKLSWKTVRYTPIKIFLGDVVLENMNLNVVPKLRDNDYIVVDTENHKSETHSSYLIYPAYLLKFDGSLYDFGGN